MADGTRRARKTRPRRERAATPDAESDGAEASREASADASELVLARRVAALTPVVTVAAAAAVAFTMSFGPALLVLAGGALFGTVAFFWASLRTLGGDAPLAEGFDLMAHRRVLSPQGAEERKRAALRALKDIALEHSIGKIDDADFAELSARYRGEAKAILREMDGDIGPLRERAEQLARGYLEKRGLFSDARETPPDAPREEAPESEAPGSARRLLCGHCKAENEIDAKFCKKCGERLRPRECARCSAMNEPDAVFCKKCGGGLDAAAEHGEETSDASR